MSASEIVNKVWNCAHVLHVKKLDTYKLMLKPDNLSRSHFL